MTINTDNNQSSKSANSNGMIYKQWSYLPALMLFASIGLAACGGGADSSRSTEVTPDPTTANPGAPRNQEVKDYQDNVWQNLRTADACGDCHRPGAKTPTRPYFVDWNNINEAYDVMVNGGYVLSKTPAASELVTRVRNGHGNCWRATDDECADDVITYITNWVNGYQKGSESREVQLTPIPANQLQDPGESLLFQVTAPASYSGVHNLLTQHCAGCHVSTSSQAQTPFFAVADMQSSYNAAKIKIDLNSPPDSDFVNRLSLRHNCWSDCATDAAEMQTAIQALADDIALSNVPLDANQIIISKALTLLNGIQASGGNRYESDQIALYEFKSRGGDVVEDSSNVNPLLNLTLYGTEGVDYRWLNNWGIEFLTPQARAQGKTANSKKLHDLIKLSGQYSIEAWVIPGNVTQMNSNIISYSAGDGARNFTLGQNMYNYEYLNRTSNTDTNGAPRISTPNADENLQATLQHVVVTYDRQTGRKIYVNGLLTNAVESTTPGDLLNWHSSYALIFGNEDNSNRPWQGTLRMVAIHDRALNLAQIETNYSAEVGQKYLMPFSVSHITGMAESYVVFEVSQFDEFSYLFSAPRYVNLADNTPTNIELGGMRIGLNGDEVPVGQAYPNILITDLANGYTPESGTILSDVDTIIELQNGANIDEFFLTFESLGPRTRTLVYNENDADPVGDIPPLPTVDPVAKSSDIGVRTFEEINATMAKMTGINDWATVASINNSNPQAPPLGTYVLYKQQFPAVENIETFLPSHQMAIAQLALAYCNVLVDRDDDLIPSNANRYFANFDYDVTASLAFQNQADLDRVINPLLTAMLNVGDLANDVSPNNLVTQPDVSTVRTEVEQLIRGDGGTRAGMTDAACMSAIPSCDNTTRTRNIVKAACTSVLGSAGMLIQ